MPKLTDDQKTPLNAILSAALHNTEVVLNQIESLRDVYGMQNVEQQLSEAVEAIKSAQKDING